LDNFVHFFFINYRMNCKSVLLLVQPAQLIQSTDNADRKL